MSFLVTTMARREDKEKVPELATIESSLPRQESKYADEAERFVRDFAATYGVKPTNFEGYNTMSRFLYPGAVSAERLAAACMVHSLFFFIDDLFFDSDKVIDPRLHGIEPELCREPRRVVELVLRLMNAFKARALSKEPDRLEEAFQYAGVYVAKQAGGDEAWFQYFVETVEDYINAVAFRNRDMEEHVRDLESFTEMRERDTGGLHTCVLIELTNAIALPEEMREDPTMQRLTQLCIRQASFVNDIVSYPKDVLHEDSKFNLIKLLMDKKQLGFAEGAREAIAIVNECNREFLQLAKEFEANESHPEVKRYVRGLQELMSGHVYWELTTERYRTKGSPFPELESESPPQEVDAKVNGK
jgi:hypothetical protein